MMRVEGVTYRRHVQKWLIVAACAVIGHAASAGSLAPVGGPWQSGGGLPFDKDTRKSVSGIACALQPAPRRCLLALDEGIATRTILLGDGSYAVDEKPLDLPLDGAELDAEAAAADNGYYYLAGSHARKRKHCDENPASHHLLRIGYDPASGAVLTDANGKISDITDATGLDKVFAAVSGVKEHLDDCLKDGQGVDIEGMAVMGPKLYLGFRGPANAGYAPILALDKKALFANEPASPELTNLEVGKGRGIRDLAAVKDGILVLAGPGDAEPSAGTSPPTWTFSLWDGSHDDGGKATPKLLTELDLSGVALRDGAGCDDKEIKPEGIAVLSDEPHHLKILVLSDGMCDGGPLVFSVDF